MIKTILITPPIFDIQVYIMPTMSIPQLVSFLKNKKYDVEHFNIEENIYFDLLSKEGLTKLFYLTRIKLLPKTKQDQSISQEINLHINNIVSQDQYLNILFDRNKNDNLLEQLLALEPVLIQLIYQGLEDLKNNLIRAEPSSLSLWKLGLLLITLAYHPLYIDINTTLVFDKEFLNMPNILKAINNTEQNFLIAYYEKYLLPKLLEKKPQLLGLTIMVQNQFIPAFTLLNLIRKHLPATKIIVGGMLIKLLKEYFLKQPEIWNYFDYLCAGPGEDTLEGLILFFQNKVKLNEIPNLIYQENQEYIINPTKEIPMSEVLTPEFTTNSFQHLLPLQITNGCYWHKCIFCAYSSFEPQELSIRPTALIIKDLQQLINKYRPPLITFIDGAVPPKTCFELAQAIIQNNLKLKYCLRIRAEEYFLDENVCQLMAKSGCQFVYFALESANQRVNDLCLKGIKVNNVEKIMRNFHKAGIKIYLHVMLGFPSETQEEIFKTKDFILKNLKYITNGPILSPFSIWQGISILKNPEKFKLKNIRPKNWCQDFPLEYDYDLDNGLQPKEILKIYEDLYQEINKNTKNLERFPKFKYIEYIGKNLSS